MHWLTVFAYSICRLIVIPQSDILGNISVLQLIVFYETIYVYVTQKLEGQPIKESSLLFMPLHWL